MALGQRVIDRRADLSLSQEELATLTGLKRQAIQGLEYRDSIDSNHLSVLAKALMVNLEWLVTGEGASDELSAPEGTKDDRNKARFDLIPPKALEQVAQTLAYGAAKYGADNWRHVDGAQARYFAAAQRHLWTWRKAANGHVIAGRADEESGISHLAHAICSLMFMLETGVDE